MSVCDPLVWFLTSGDPPRPRTSPTGYQVRRICQKGRRIDAYFWRILGKPNRRWTVPRCSLPFARKVRFYQVLGGNESDVVLPMSLANSLRARSTNCAWLVPRNALANPFRGSKSEICPTWRCNDDLNFGALTQYMGHIALSPPCQFPITWAPI